MSQAVIDKVICKIEANFGKMTMSQGQLHELLGMMVTFGGNHTVEIRMKEFLQQVICKAGGNLGKMASTPAQCSFFDVYNELPLLLPTKVAIFHRMVAQLLYVSCHGRPDLQLAIGFL